jgi:hypothetical protein
MDRNPFQFATPLADPEQLVGRDAELHRLAELAGSGTYVMLEAPRRFGKTSLIKACAERWRSDGGLAVWVDFSRVLTVDEAALRLETALEPAQHGGWSGVLGELLRSLRLRLGPVEVGRPGAAGAEPVPTARLHELLDVAAAAAREQGRRSLLCFDEFQDVLAVPGLDGIVRAHVQHQADDVSYVFSGSEPSLLRSLFAERGRPLYAQAKPLRLGRIAPDALATRVVRQFADAGVEAGPAVELIASVAAGHPQRTMLLAWHLWDRADGERALGLEDGEDAIDAALHDAQPEFEAVWRSLAGNERRVAVALALGLPPFGKESQRQTGLASASAAQRAIERLLERGLAERETDPAVLTDPLLSTWLAREHSRGSRR